MKAIRFILYLMMISVSYPAPGAENMPEGLIIGENLDSRDLHDLFDSYQDYFTSVDYMLDRLLAIPEEKRQYYFPMLHEYRILPHKITSHPQIIIWKGKKPTVIAPQLQEYARTYLDALPPQFYPILDPDKWATMREHPETLNETISLDDIPLLPDNPQAPNPDYKLKSLAEIYHVPDTLPPDYLKTDLTGADVKRTVATLNQIPAFIDGLEERLGSRLRDYLSANLAFDLAWPFREWINHIDDTQHGAALDTFLKEQGWKNRDEFMQKADRLLKAYRVSTMTLPEAIAISGFRKKYPIKENEKFIPIQMLTEFYNAKGSDALFAEKYAAELKTAFQNQDLLRVGLPIQLLK